MSWPKGPDPSGDPGLGDTRMASAVRPSPWSPGKSCFTRAQQVGVDRPRGGSWGLREGRKVGACPPARRSQTRPGDACRARDAASSDVPWTPARSPEVGSQKATGECECAFCVEDHFQSFPQGKKAFARVAFA